MVRQWSCFGSWEPSAASHPLSSRKQWPVLLPLMAASCTWWALLTSVTAAKRMWLRWASNNLKQDVYSVLSHLQPFKNEMCCKLSENHLCHLWKWQSAVEWCPEVLMRLAKCNFSSLINIFFVSASPLLIWLLSLSYPLPLSHSVSYHTYLLPFFCSSHRRFELCSQMWL